MVQALSAEALITTHQLCGAGHVHQKDDGRIPKIVLFSELKSGKRSQGEPKLQFKDMTKRKMKQGGVPHDTWEEAAADRDKWRGMLRRATLAIEEEHKQEYHRAHDQRPSAATSDKFQCSICKQSCRSQAGLQPHMRACLRRPST